MTRQRFAAFAGVGALGFVVQLSTLGVLTLVGVSPVAATCLAVEAAILHNFVWHERLTWADRGHGSERVAERLAKFNVSTGLTSILGSAVLGAAFLSVRPALTQAPLAALRHK